jgi:hypothetical protein
MKMSELSKILHPMTIGDILDRSIQLYKSNFLKFIGIVLLVKGPYLILAYILGYILTDLIMLASPEMPYYLGESIALSLIRLLELLFVGPILIAAATMAISERFLDRDIGITEAYKRILRRFFPLLGTILLTGAIISAVLLGCVFLGFSAILAGVQPGLIMVTLGLVLAGVLWIWYTFIPQTVVIEGEGGITAMKRSKYLVKGYFLKAFVLIVLVFIAVALITGIISFGIVKALFFLGEYGQLLAEGTSNVVSVFLEPFRIAAVTLLYYDFRIRKEGFDLEIMAEELEASMSGDH